MANYKITPLAVRFWRKVNKTDSCWLWTGAVKATGYGAAAIGNHKARQAHRVAWELCRGPIPDGLCVCHKCDVRLCVNPDHLFLGTRTENMQDCAKKGRQNSKLKPDDVRQIRQQYQDGVPARILAQQFSVDKSMVHLILKRRWWSHVT